MYTNFRVTYLLFLSGCNELEFSLQMFENYSDTKIYENPSCGSPVVPRGRTDTDMTKH